jgi:hypothetical protein
MVSLASARFSVQNLAAHDGDPDARGADQTDGQ